MPKIITIEGRRDGYAPIQVDRTMTVGELVEFLSQYEDDCPIMISNDGGYTYGSISYDSFDEIEQEVE